MIYLPFRGARRAGRPIHNRKEHNLYIDETYFDHREEIQVIIKTEKKNTNWRERERKKRGETKDLKGQYLLTDIHLFKMLCFVNLSLEDLLFLIIIFSKLECSINGSETGWDVIWQHLHRRN